MTRPLARGLCLLAFAAFLACDGADEVDLVRLHNLGKAHFENGETTEALQYFEECLAADPESWKFRMSVAKANFLAENHEIAISQFEALVEERPESADALYNLGILKKRVGDIAGATAALERFVAVEPGSVPGRYNLALLFVRQERHDEAATLLDFVLEREPTHAAAYYQRYVIERSRGNRAAATSALETFEALKKEVSAERLTSASLEESPYFEIDVDQPDHALAAPVAAPPISHETMATLTFADRVTALAALGDRLVAGTANGTLRVGLPTDDGASWSTVSSGGAGAVTQIVAVDFDNDGPLDLVVVSGGLLRLLRGEAGVPRDVSEAAGVASIGDCRRVSVGDVDHDGDLDLLLSSDTRPLRLLRNEGSPDEAFSVFSDVTDAAGLGGLFARDVAIADFDRDNDLDLVLLTSEGLRGARNLGRVRFAPEPAGVPAEGDRLIAVDVTGDRWADLIVVGDRVTLFANDGALTFAGREAVDVGAAASVAAADVDLDGTLDLIVAAEGALRVRDWDGTAGEPLAAFEGAPGGVVAADLDGDGDFDLAVAAGEQAVVLRAESAGAAPSIRVQLTGGRSNRYGVGAEVEARSGDFIVTRLVEGPETTIGVGDRATVDYVRVTWPSGIVQNEVDLAVSNEPVAIEEKPEPLGSCPSLYAWDGERVRFVTDIFGTSTIGFPFQGGETMPFDDEELIRLPEWACADGEAFPIHITEELNEVAYVDRVEFWTVDHPDTLALYSNTVLRSPPFPDPEALAIAEESAPLWARHDRDGDVLDQLTEADGRYVTGFERLESQFHGVTKEHALSLGVPDRFAGRDVVLVVEGWVDWPETPQFVSLGQNGSVDMIIPTIEAEIDGEWATLAAFGIQALKPKTVVVELGRLPADVEAIHVRSNLATHFDRMAFGVVVADPPLERVVQRPVSADVHYRGFASLYSPDESALTLYDYERVNLAPIFTPSIGAFTRYGEVTSLVTSWDDRSVVMNAGDELSIDFAADGAPAPLPAGWTRTRFVRVSGFAKEADYHTHFAGRVEPMPFRGMSAYPYPSTEAFPPALEGYLERYNTRIVGSSGGR